MQANNVRKISAITKVLKRPNRYIGAASMVTEVRYIFKDGKMIKQETKYVPGLIKIIREVIDNCIDEGVRTKFKFANKIDITTTNSEIKVSDNGRGIPIIPIESDDDVTIDMMMPEGAWTELDAGSNFDDEEDNETLGQNGEGVSLTCIFSKKFVGHTINDKKSFTLTALNNLSEKETKLGKTTKTPGTTVTFTPDYERFGLKGFDDIHEQILAYDIVNLALMYPGIKFTLNGKVVKANSFKDYVNMYSENFNGKPEIVEGKGLKVAVMNNPTDSFEYVHFINGLNVANGGKPLNWAMQNVVNGLTEKVAKKYKNIKAGDVKNKLFTIVLFDGMFNPRFEDQIKSVCSNTYTQFKSQIEEPKWDTFVDKIHKNKDILEPITEVYRIKEEFAKRQELKKLDKTAKKIKSEKYFPATHLKKYLILAEGASARGGLMPVLGRKEFGYYELKGVPLNAYDSPQSKFTNNTELSELYQIIRNEGYQYIIFGTDQDLDGFHIRGLLLGFFYRYAPEYLEKQRCGVLNTPILGAKKAGKITKWWYKLNDYTEAQAKGMEVKYYKGLGSWKEKDLKEIIKKDGIGKMMDMFEVDDPTILDDWLLGTKADTRKEYIKQNEFSLIKL